MSILQKPQPPASRTQLDALIRRCAPNPIPATYLAFLSASNGGYSPDASVALPDGTRTGELSFLGVGLSAADQDIERTWTRLGARLRPGLMPVVRDGGGGAFCIRLTAPAPGSIWFWDADTSKAVETHASWDDLVQAIRID